MFRISQLTSVGIGAGVGAVCPIGVCVVAVWWFMLVSLWMKSERASSRALVFYVFGGVSAAGAGGVDFVARGIGDF